MSHAWTHPWCKSPTRDEAVRAAEDGRIGPLPTLAEAISAARAMMPKSVSGSSAPERENKGNRMRTERVTLEVTHGAAISASEWPMWSTIFDSRHGESVRVVDECCLDRINMGEVIRERDAAIRERDEAKEQAERLRARVAEMDAASVAAGIEITEGDCLSTVRDRGRRPMPKGPPPGLVTPPTTKAASGAASSSAGPKSSTNGCLTEEERKALTLAADQAPESDFVTNAEGEWIKETLTALLARSTPPEVVKPNEKHYHHFTCESRDADWLAALAAACVTVKEVGRE